MKWIINMLMRRRAERLAKRLRPFLCASSRILDVGCGTGHNAEAIGTHSLCAAIDGVDVVSMAMVGNPPIIFDGLNLPFDDDSYDTAVLLFILHYSSNPVNLLREVRRVVADRVIVIQSTYNGPLALFVLWMQEFFMGRAAYYFARGVRAVPSNACPLVPLTFMQQRDLLDLFQRSGWTPIKHIPEYLPGTALSRDLFVLKKALDD